ncbi:MAG: hypothetical protein O9332_22455 [Microcystis sp. LE19-10.1B]|uniref:hypothetical protein n=1 Tax=Microcystis sp. LE19-10.1B TaxID=3016428 RepID=UPI0022C2DC6B|nr:hypothetical protein [Microcystis sp. LE19-10.1B]MCZ8028067.1 hypothetical protein [Microcystis sp. LE19-10.1B]
MVHNQLSVISDQLSVISYQLFSPHTPSPLSLLPSPHTPHPTPPTPHPHTPTPQNPKTRDNFLKKTKLFLRRGLY